MTYRIVFLRTSQTKVIQHVRAGFIKELNRSLGSNGYTLYERGDLCDQSALRDTLMSILRSGSADIIVVFGICSTMTVLEETQKRCVKIPVVFAGVVNPIELGIIRSLDSSGNNCTGVMMEPQKQILPAQAILKIRPNIRKILVPYRPGLQAGRAHHDALRISDYFAERGVEVVLHPISNEKIDQVALRKAFDNVDAGINLEAGLYENEINEVAEIAKKANTPFWADGEEAAKHGALCAVKTDFHYIGAVKAQQVVKVLVDGLAPSDIPTRVLPSSRRLEINDKLAAQRGVVLTDEIEVSIERTFAQSKDLISKNILMVMPKPCCIEQPLVSELIARMRSDTDTFYDHRQMMAWPHGTPELDRAALVYLDQRMSNVDAVIMLSDKFGKKICNHFINTQVKTPIITLDLADDILDDPWHRTAEKHGIQVVRGILPKSPLLVQFELLHAIKPQMKECNLLLWGDDRQGGFLPLTLQRVKPLQDACTELGIACTIRMINDTGSFDQVIEYLKPGSCWLFLDSNLPFAIVNDFADLCQERKVICAAGSLVWARKFAFNVGIDAEKATRQIHPIMKGILEDERPPAYRKVYFDPNELIHISINEQLCQKLDIPLNQLGMLLVRHSIVPVDYALDTAAFMQQIDAVEHRKIRKARARKRAALLQEPSSDD